MTAADYVRELRLGAQDDESDHDDDEDEDTESEADAEAMAEEVQEEMDKAAAAWAKAVTGGSASSVDLGDKKGSDALLCAFVEGLGTTYDRRQHGGALRRAAAAAGAARADSGPPARPPHTACICSLPLPRESSGLRA
jgi:hypothetical protein